MLCGQKLVGALPARRECLTLDGREVGADDLGFGVLVGEIDGPYAGAGADVEDWSRH